jgi:hypothetical protein
VHQTWCFAKHTLPLQLADEKSWVNSVRNVEKTIWFCLNIPYIGTTFIFATFCTQSTLDFLLTSCSSMSCETPSLIYSKDVASSVFRLRNQWWYSERFEVNTRQLQAAMCALSSQLFGSVFTLLENLRFP